MEHYSILDQSAIGLSIGKQKRYRLAWSRG